MQKRIAFLFCAAAICCGDALALPVFSLDPVDGALQGTHGATIGWGFVVHPDAVNWISFTGSGLQHLGPTLVGDYVDLIGSAGGPVNGVLAPGVSPWIEAFDSGLGTGGAEFIIALNAAAGSIETGQIVLFYDEFSDDPNTCGSCYLDSKAFTAAFEIDVVSAAAPVASPEPAMPGLPAMALLSWLVWSKKYRTTVKRTT